jgi:hypothetical protein
LSPALLGPGPDGHDVVVGRVEERLELDPSQRTPSGPSLVLGGVHRHVLGPTDLARDRAELGQARRCPAIGGVASEVAECADGELVAADRRMGQLLVRAQFADPVLEVPGQPLPWPDLSMLAEPAHQALAGVDGVLVEGSRQLLITPALQHRLECFASGADVGGLRLRQPQPS